MLNWFQALPPDLSSFLGIPGGNTPDAVLVREGAPAREIRQLKESSYALFSNNRLVKGLTFNSPGVLAETFDTLVEMRTAAATPVSAVFECFDNQAAEFWKHVIQSTHNHALRKGHFVLAEIAEANSRLFNPESPQYKRAVNPDGDHVPDGAVSFEDRAQALRFLNEVCEACGVTRSSHGLSSEEYEKAVHLSGFDLSGFKRMGAALGDPLFLAGTNAHRDIRQRLKALFRRNSLSHLKVGGLHGNKTAAEIREIYHQLVKDYATDIPKHFDLLKEAVLAVEQDYPKIKPHEELSTKTWHNNVSGVLGGSSNVTNNHLTAKWAVILSVIAAHNRDLSPVHETVTAERLFFWVVYGTPLHLIESAGKMGVTLTGSVLPPYPRTAYADISLRAPIVRILDQYPPHRGDDWESNFVQRMH